MSAVTKWEAFCLEMAQQLEQQADEHNKKIADIAGVPYDPTPMASGIRRDTGTAHGIRRAADYVRSQARSQPEGPRSQVVRRQWERA